MRRLVRRIRHRARRWPEETHMMIAGAIAITLIFGAVFLAAKLGAAPTNNTPPAAAEKKL